MHTMYPGSIKFICNQPYELDWKITTCWWQWIEFTSLPGKMTEEWNPMRIKNGGIYWSNVQLWLSNKKWYIVIPLEYHVSTVCIETTPFIQFTNPINNRDIPFLSLTICWWTNFNQIEPTESVDTNKPTLQRASKNIFTFCHLFPIGGIISYCLRLCAKLFSIKRKTGTVDLRKSLIIPNKWHDM